MIEETIFLESYLNIAADGLFLFSSFYSKVCWRVSFGQSLFLITPIFDKNLPGLRRQKRKEAEISKCKLPKSLKSLKCMKTFETLLPKISAMDVFKFWLLGEMAVYETFKESQEEGNVIHKKMFCVLIFPLFSIKTFINETCILFPIVWRKMDSLYQNFAQGVCRRPHSFSEFSDWEYEREHD